MTVSNIPLLMYTTVGKSLQISKEILNIVMIMHSKDYFDGENNRDHEILTINENFDSRGITYVIKMLKQSHVLTYSTHDGPVHFFALRLQRKINMQLISKLISFHLEKIDFSTCYILQGWP